MPLLIKNGILSGKKCDVLIENGLVSKIGDSISPECECEIFDACGNCLVPPFYNCHTHSPMNLLRGFADDLPLEVWLKEHIWPREASLTRDDIRRGAILAIEEMIRSGTVFFNDMYWMGEEALSAAAISGIRAVIGLFMIDGDGGEVVSRQRDSIARTKAAYDALPKEAKERIRLAYAPHSVYGCGEKTLLEARDAAKKENAFIHIHVSETEEEVAGCLKKYGECPVMRLERLGLLTEKTILAHCVHLTEEEMELIAFRKSVISHQPISNYKLASGAFKYHLAVEKHKCRFVIGTDGAASNNNLSMFDEMKFASLNAKMAARDPASGKAGDIFRAATLGGCEAFGFNGGRIEKGALGDVLVLDKNSPQSRPCHSLESSVVYAFDTSCVSALISAGKVLYRKNAAK